MGEVSGSRRLTVSVQQAADRVGVSRRTIYNWMRDAKVHYVRTAGGAVRIYEDSLWRAGNEPGKEASA